MKILLLVFFVGFCLTACVTRPKKPVPLFQTISDQEFNQIEDDFDEDEEIERIENGEYDFENSSF